MKTSSFWPAKGFKFSPVKDSCYKASKYSVYQIIQVVFWILVEVDLVLGQSRNNFCSASEKLHYSYNLHR